MVAPGDKVSRCTIADALFTLKPGEPNTIGPHKRPLHTIIPAFMEKDSTRIGFGIMGGWNQSQAHAQFVSNIADFGMNIQAAMEAARFTKGSFGGCDVSMESRISPKVRDELTAMGHMRFREWWGLYFGTRWVAGGRVVEEATEMSALRGVRSEGGWGGGAGGSSVVRGEEITADPRILGARGKLNQWRLAAER